MRASESNRAESAPGPWVRALFTFGPELLRRDPVDIAVDLREQYGHVVRTPPVYPGFEKSAYLVTHPDDVQYVLQSNPDAFRGLAIPSSDDFAAVEGSILGPPGGGDMEWWIERLRQLAPSSANTPPSSTPRARADDAMTTRLTRPDPCSHTRTPFNGFSSVSSTILFEE